MLRIERTKIEDGKIIGGMSCFEKSPGVMRLSGL